jgi:hypothetical protein
LARSFLLLEDDYDVDWEVDQDEPSRGCPREREQVLAGSDPALEALEGPDRHPHRSWLRERSRRSRGGAAMPAAQICLCPRPHQMSVKRTPTDTGRPRATRT